MQAGTGLEIAADIINALKASGFIAPDGSFDETKVSDMPGLSALISAVKTALTSHGVVLPPKVDAVIALVEGVIPLVEQLAK